MNNKLLRLGLPLVLSCLILVSLATLAACSGTTTSSQRQAPEVNRVSAATSNQTPSANLTRGAAAPAGGQTATKAATQAVHIIADGRLSFARDEKLTFGTSGKVAQVKVKELDRVTKGQVLAQLDTTALDRAVKAAEIALKAAELTAQSAEGDRQQAEFSVKSAEVDLKQVQDTVKSAGIDLQTAANSLAKISYPYTYATFSVDVPTAIAAIYNAQMNLNQAAANLQPGTANYADALSRFNDAQNSLTAALQQLGRGVNLDTFVTSANQTTVTTGTKTVPSWATTDFWTLRAAQLVVDKAQMAVTSAQNSVDKTTLAVGNTRTALNKAQIALDKAKNDVDRARNDLDTAKDNRDKAIITAPFDGVVAAVNVKEGDTLSSSSYATTTAIELIDPSQMELNFNVNELDIPDVKPGQKVTITVNALPGQRISGTVSAISTLPITEGGVVSYEVKTLFDVPRNSALRAGMAATADITVD